MSPRPSGTSIDRIDNDGDYSPENCRWATFLEQQNNRRDNVVLTHLGRSQTIPEWARETGISPMTIRERILTMQWPTDRALTQPVGNQGPKKPGYKTPLYPELF